MANAATSDNNELNITVEQPKAWARRMKITVPAARMERQRREVTTRLARQVRLPGFRKGKIPPQVVERQFGASIQQEALEKVIGEAYKEAVAKEGLEPITQASVSNLEYKPGEDVHFDVDFEVRPQVELERLGGFQLKREKRAVGEAEIERVVERLREEKAIWEPVAEAQPAMGEMVSVEITPFDDDGAPQENKTRPYQIILGRGEAAPEVETAIQSLAPGGEGEFTIAHPAEEGHEGHSHRARVRLKETKRPRYPEVDDDFAKAAGDFDTATEMRARIRTDLEREAEQDAETEVRRQLVEQIIDANAFEVPDGMVAQYLERLLPAREGSNPERVAEARQGMVPAAQRAIKRMLVIERVAELESLQATPSEIEARLEDLAQRYGRPAGEVRKQLQKNGQLAALEDEVTEEKVFTYLKSLSSVE
jgi:trigger factor